MRTLEYSTNIQNKERINNFFAKLGYIPQYRKKTEPAAIGMGEEVVRFRVPGFRGREVPDKLFYEWQRMPIEIC